MKHALSAISALLILALLLGGCQAAAPVDATGSSPALQDTTATAPPDAAQQPAAPSDNYAAENLDASWDDTATVIDLSDGGSQVSGEGASVSGSTVTISQAGTYVLRGTLSDGQVLVDAKDALVRLVLAGVSLSNSATAAIYAKDAEKTVLILAEGTQNTVSESANFAYAGGDDGPDATVYAQDDLTITGSGSLRVTSVGGNAVVSKDTLRITDGSITVSAADDALRGRDGVAICGGAFDLTAVNDAIKSNNDQDADKGWIALDGGTFTINAGQDGVQAETALAISDGSFNVTSGGGAAAAPERPAEQFAGQWPGGGRFNQQPTENSAGATPAPTTADPAAAATPESTAADDTQTTSDSTSDSYKAFKAGAALTVTGGTFTVDAQDDAFHSNGSLTVSGGTFALSTGDDAFHADAAMLVQGGQIDISACYEGIEGATVDITGGEIAITASDDGINAAGGSDAATGPMGNGGWGQGGDSFASGSEYYIRISGGNITINAGADGIDANGNLTIDGGTVLISSANGQAETALDADGAITVNGGTVAAFGGRNMNWYPGDASQQPSLVVVFSESQSANTTLSLRDDAGSVLVEYAPPSGYTSAVLSASGLAVGSSYALYSGETKLADVQLSATVTAINQDGSAADLSQQSFGGGRGPGGRGPESQRPEGQRPEGQGPGGQLPDGTTLPDGMTPPDGVTPPDGMTFPDGMTPPGGEWQQDEPPSAPPNQTA